MSPKPLLSLIACLVFSVCMYAQSKEPAALPALPPDFNPSQGVLLIEDSTDGDNRRLWVTGYGTSYNAESKDYANAYFIKDKKKLIKYAEKNYPYGYEFASHGEIFDSASAYSDRNKYRFALVISIKPPVGSGVRLDNHGNQYTPPSFPTFLFHLYDRLTNTIYAPLGRGSYQLSPTFQKAINAITGKK